MCISWTIKCLISLMHGVTVKISYKFCYSRKKYSKYLKLKTGPIASWKLATINTNLLKLNYSNSSNNFDGDQSLRNQLLRFLYYLLILHRWRFPPWSSKFASMTRQYGIYGGQKQISLRASPCKYHSTNSPYLLIHISSTPYFKPRN